MSTPERSQDPGEHGYGGTKHDFPTEDEPKNKEHRLENEDDRTSEEPGRRAPTAGRSAARRRALRARSSRRPLVGLGREEAASGRAFFVTGGCLQSRDSGLVLRPARCAGSYPRLCPPRGVWCAAADHEAQHLLDVIGGSAEIDRQSAVLDFDECVLGPGRDELQLTEWHTSKWQADAAGIDDEPSLDHPCQLDMSVARRARAEARIRRACRVARRAAWSPGSSRHRMQANRGKQRVENPSRSSSSCGTNVRTKARSSSQTIPAHHSPCSTNRFIGSPCARGKPSSIHASQLPITTGQPSARTRRNVSVGCGPRDDIAQADEFLHPLVSEIRHALERGKVPWISESTASRTSNQPTPNGRALEGAIALTLAHGAECRSSARLRSSGPALSQRLPAAVADVDLGVTAAVEGGRADRRVVPAL